MTKTAGALDGWKWRDYDRTPNVVDAGLIARYEIIRMAGFDEVNGAGARWWVSVMDNKRLPPADGQIVNGRPTWTRPPILRALWRMRRADGQRRLDPAYWKEAIACGAVPCDEVCPNGHQEGL